MKMTTHQLVIWLWWHCWLCWLIVTFCTQQWAGLNRQIAPLQVTHTYASWAYWAGLTFLLATPAILWIINTREAKGKVDRLVANISGIVIVLILAFYLLADNELPLSCSVGEFTESTTIVNSSDEQRITETRFAFWVVILVLHAPLVAANIAGKCYYRYCETGHNRPVNWSFVCVLYNILVVYFCDYNHDCDIFA